MKPYRMTDMYQRTHDYLRLSVTDKCSLRCTYCMPEDGLAFFPDHCLLSTQEIIAMVDNFCQLGVDKVRLTGGEPLMRKDILEIVEGIHQLSAVKDLSMTTNGLALKRLAQPLRDAGLHRLNISLDTFDQKRYRMVTRGGNLKQVLAGIEAAIAANFDEIKLNVVVIQGQNDQELRDFLSYTFEHDVTVRFIEYMPIGQANQKKWQDAYKGVERVFDICHQEEWTYRAIEMKGNGPAKNFQMDGAKGRFGLIHPISCQFCAACNRLRVTADGYLKACLFWEDEINLRPYLTDFQLFENKVKEALARKPENHEMALDTEESKLSEKPTWRHMSQIGG